MEVTCLSKLKRIVQINAAKEERQRTPGPKCFGFELNMISEWYSCQKKKEKLILKEELKM